MKGEGGITGYQGLRRRAWWSDFLRLLVVGNLIADLYLKVSDALGLRDKVN
jgi:hypothetical protein